MAKLTAHKMRPVAVSRQHAATVELRDGTPVREWHITMYEVRDAAGEPRGYRTHCGDIIGPLDAVLEPGRKGAFCYVCSQNGPLPK